MAKIIGNLVGMPSPPQETGVVSWDGIQNNGARDDYSGAFRYWGNEQINPKYKVEPTGMACEMFYECRNLKSIDKNLFDLSKAEYYAKDERSAGYNLCAQCRALEVFPDIGLQAGYYGSTWWSCTELHTIEIMRVTETSVFTVGSFRGCKKLQNILNIVGEIGRNIWFVQSPLLSVETQKRLIKRLKNYKGTSSSGNYAFAFNPTAYAALEASGFTEEDKAWLEDTVGISWNEETTWVKVVIALGWMASV